MRYAVACGLATSDPSASLRGALIAGTKKNWGSTAHGVRSIVSCRCKGHELTRKEPTVRFRCTPAVSRRTEHPQQIVTLLGRSASEGANSRCHVGAQSRLQSCNVIGAT
jgi:hypothetical protein